MSNWCIGCGKEIPDGDLCRSCKENYDPEWPKKLSPEETERRLKELAEGAEYDDIPF